MATCISAILLQAKHEDISKKLIGKKVIPMTGAAFSIVLLLLVAPLQIMISLCLLGVGVPIYIFFSPKQELTEAKEKFLSKEARLRRACRQSKTFLGMPIHKIKLYRYGKTGECNALDCCDKGECQEKDSCKPL
jgi:hypothetical protein